MCTLKLDGFEIASSLTLDLVVSFAIILKLMIKIITENLY